MKRDRLVELKSHPQPWMNRTPVQLSSCESVCPSSTISCAPSDQRHDYEGRHRRGRVHRRVTSMGSTGVAPPHIWTGSKRMLWTEVWAIHGSQDWTTSSLGSAAESAWSFRLDPSNGSSLQRFNPSVPQHLSPGQFMDPLQSPELDSPTYASSQSHPASCT